MAIYYVNQGKTYEYERDGGYIWSPKLTKSGGQNKGYNLMTTVKRGDYLLHNSKGKITAISIVEEDCKSEKQPEKLKNGQSQGMWNDDGWIIYTSYYEVSNPVPTSSVVDWMINNYKADSAFQINGKSKLQYLCTLDDSHARYLIKKMLIGETNNAVKSILEEALAMEGNYSQEKSNSAKEENQIKSSRIKWNSYETALLIDTYMAINENPKCQESEIALLSNKLRYMATASGIAIDETYRNINGIKLQLEAIAPYFSKEKKRRNSAAIFEKMVGLYNTDPETFQRVLDEAKEKVKNYDRAGEVGAAETQKQAGKDDFKASLLEDKKYLADDLFILLKAESNSNPYGTTATYLARKLGVQEINVKNILSISPWAKYEYGKYRFALEDEKKVNKVIFNEVQTYTYTKPVKVLYFGELINEGPSWRKAYLDCARVLYDDYPQVFENIIASDNSAQEKILFLENEIANITIPGEVCENKYIELNLPARNIVDNLKRLLDACNVDYDNLEIEFSYRDIVISEENQNPKEIPMKNKESPSVDKQLFNDIEKENTTQEVSISEGVNKRRYQRQSQEVFYRWLKDEKSLSSVEASKIIATVNQMEQFAKITVSSKCRLFSSDVDLITFTIQSLIENNAFQNKNKKLNNRYYHCLQLLLESTQIVLNLSTLCMCSELNKTKETQGAMPNAQRSQDFIQPLVDKINAMIKSAANGIDKKTFEAEMRGYNKATIETAISICKPALIAGKYYHKDNIFEYQEMAEIVYRALQKQFLSNDNYTSAKQLFKEVHPKLDDFFFYNGAFESQAEIYDLATFLFTIDRYKGEQYIFQNKTHIWKTEPEYSKDYCGLLLKYTRDHNNVVFRDEIEKYFEWIGSTSPSATCSFVLSTTGKDVFVQCDESKYTTVEYLAIDEVFLDRLYIQLEKLFDEDDYIAFGAIDDFFYSTLPDLPVNIIWTPYLVEEIIRIYKMKYSIIRAGKKEDKKTIPAAIVKQKSAYKTFGDIVWKELSKKEQLPIEISATQFRQFLLDSGFIRGTEKMWNVHSTVADDIRFLWSDNNNKVTISL